MAVVVDTNKGAAIWDLRKIAARIEKDSSVVTADLMEEVESYFDQLIDYVWELNPSNATAHMLRSLEELGMYDWFVNYLKQSERELPPITRGGWPVHWLVRYI